MKPNIFGFDIHYIMRKGGLMIPRIVSPTSYKRIVILFLLFDVGIKVLGIIISIFSHPERNTEPEYIR